MTANQLNWYLTERSDFDANISLQNDSRMIRYSTCEIDLIKQLCCEELLSYIQANGLMWGSEWA